MTLIATTLTNVPPVQIELLVKNGSKLDKSTQTIRDQIANFAA
jgi:hypothetical protein